MADDGNITLTPTALDRITRVAKTRERMRIAMKIEELAVEAPTIPADRLHALVEELRSENVVIDRVSPEMAQQSRDLEIARVDAAAAEEDVLPPVHHLDDFAEGAAMVRNLAGRGLL